MFMVVPVLENNTLEVKMKPVEFIIKEGDEHLTSHSGLALIGALLNRTELGRGSTPRCCPDAGEPKIPNGDATKSRIGLCAWGSLTTMGSRRSGRFRFSATPWVLG